MFWLYVWTFIGFGFIIASLSEMASMAPTDGGQYHWVSEFCSPRYQKFLSYITGWMSVLAWQSGTASGSFLTGTIIQGLISVRNPDYDPKGWQGTLLVFSMVLVTYIFNVYASDLMPILSNILMILHVLSWAVILIVLWAMSPHRSAEAVFVSDWENLGGLPTMGLSVMVGQISAIYGCLSTFHLAYSGREQSGEKRLIRPQVPMRVRICQKKLKTPAATYRGLWLGDFSSMESWLPSCWLPTSSPLPPSWIP